MAYRGVDATTTPLALLSAGLSIEWREHLVSALFASSVTLAVIVSDDFATMGFYWSWATLGFGFLFARKSIGPKWQIGLLSLILLSAGAAVGASYLRGSEWWITSAIIAVWMLPLMLVYVSEITKLFFTYLSLGVGVITTTVFWEFMTTDVQRASGIVTNPNHASGFLLIGTIWIMQTRFWPLAAPLIIGVAMTGSRMAMLAVVLGAALIVAFRLAEWPHVAGVLVFAAILALPINGQLQWAFSRPDPHIVNAIERIVPNRDLTVSPGGWGGPEGRLSHNVPLRILDEFGVVALGAWGVLVTATLRRAISHNRPVFVFLVVILFVSMMDSYFWIGPLGAMWWLLISMGKHHRHP